MNHLGKEHVVPAIEAVSITAAQNGDVVHCAEAHEAEIDILVGSLAADLAVIVQECDDIVPTTPAAIAFNYQKSAAVGTDAMGAVTAADTSGVTLVATTDNNKVLRIFIDPSALSSGTPYIRVVLTPASALACLVAAIYRLRVRYPQEVPSSAVD